MKHVTKIWQGLTVAAVAFFSVQAAVGAPNLTPYQPSGWSDKIVVSRTTGTSTDSTGLTTADSLYVDWAVANLGTTATGSGFHETLYVDGVVKYVYYYPSSLNASTWQGYSDYPIGSLTAGTHTVKIIADSGLEITESDETDNSYTKTITVSNPGQPNLVPYQLSGWSDTIVVSRTTGTTTDSTGLTTADTLYVDWDVANIGTAATGSGFHNTLYVDGVVKNVFYYGASLAAGVNAATYDYPISSLSAGTHTVKIVVDSGLEIAESNEGDNSYTKTISVSAALPDLVIQSITATPSTFHAGDTISVSCVVSNQGNATASQTSTQLRFNQSAVRPIGYENILTNFTTIGMGPGSAVVLSGQVTIPSGATPGTWYIWGIADNLTNLIQSGGDNDFTRSDPLTVAAAGQPNLVPYQVPGWSDTIVVSRTTGTTTDSTGLTTADSLYVDWDVANIGTAATGSGFHNTLYVDGVVKNVFYYSASLAAGVNAATYDYPIGSLSAGTHTVKIVVDSGLEIAESNEGDNSYTKTITVGSAQGPSVSASLSTLTATPSSAPADGQSNITAKVTLRDGNNNPVSGKTVQIHSGGSVTITPPTSPTDANGQATATITATAPVTTSVWAVDTTDSVVVQQQPTIQFTSAFVLPGTDLSNAISQLAAEAGNDLNPYIANLAIDEGQCGDYFQEQVNNDKAQQGVIALNAGLGGLISLVPLDQVLVSGNSLVKTSLAKAGISLVDDFNAFGIGKVVEDIAGSSTGLSLEGQDIGNNNTTYRQRLGQQKQSLLAGVPPSSINMTSAFTNDLQLRLQANHIIKLMLINQDSLLSDMRSDSEFSHDDFLTPLFTTVDIIGSVFGGPIAGETINAGESFISWSKNEGNLSVDQRSYLTAVSLLMSCLNNSEQIYLNTTSAFNEIAQGHTPNPVTGQVLDVTSELTGPQNSLSGVWTGADPVTTPAVTGNQITGGFSLVTVKNTSQQNATFIIYATYNHTITLSVLGVYIASLPYPLTIMTTTNLTAGQTAQVTINYFDGVNGALPDTASPIAVYVLGCNGNNNQNMFEVGETSSTLQWTSSGGTMLSSKLKPNGQPLDDSTSTNTFIYEIPIKCFVFQNLTNQTYQGQIWVANPFVIPLFTTVTQPLPSGITVLSTDGMLENSSIVWTNTIATNSLVEETFTFSLSTLPGAQTNLPAATLLFSDATGTNSLLVQSLSPSFNGLFPVRVNGFIPNGISGVGVAMQVTVTNLTGTSQTGSLNISLMDSTGTQVTNISQSFSVNGLVGTTLNFYLPGTLPPGSYSLTGSLNMDGGNGQVLAGAYVVSLPPLTLGLGSTTPLGSNGFNLQLQGALGSNYVIEVSTDLFNWTPVMDFTVTNSPFYFNDPAATNLSKQFYRAVMP